MKNDLISIIVPVYNAEPYLNECISSIVEQTYRNLEIILVDDGSRDNSLVICKEWEKKDSRIVVIHKENGGASSARNAGLNIARGEYIGFVDSDDMIAADMYETLLQSICTHNKKIACCRLTGNKEKFTASPVHVYSEGKTFDVEETVNGLLDGWCGTSSCTKLFQRTVFDEIRFPEGETNEEYSLLIPVTICAGGMVYIDRVMYYYRSTAESVTHTYWKKDSGIVLKNLERVQQQLELYQLDCWKAFSRFEIRNIFYLAITLDKNFLQLSEEGKTTHKKAIRIMRENALAAMKPGVLCLKHKVLYLMIITRTLRPIYKLLNRL